MVVLYHFFGGCQAVFARFFLVFVRGFCKLLSYQHYIFSVFQKNNSKCVFPRGYGHFWGRCLGRGLFVGLWVVLGWVDWQGLFAGASHSLPTACPQLKWYIHIHIYILSPNSGSLRAILSPRRVAGLFVLSRF